MRLIERINGFLHRMVRRGGQSKVRNRYFFLGDLAEAIDDLRIHYERMEAIDAIFDDHEDLDAILKEYKEERILRRENALN
mmetsp:Transcript_1812/g.3978  ORF Transcript_1812/g.3978 Transcript_1812/m.3978 type:complete len:81 (+) Transcript_1812:567-809(+)